MSGILQGVLASIGGAPATYIEDVFSTYLYTGNSSTQSITNGIDLSGKGGLVWIKARTVPQNNNLYDTVRGATNQLVANQTSASTVQANGLTNFTTTGFTLGFTNGVNQIDQNFVSWTFREQAKFFDVVTYTGNGSNRTIAHNLGSVPGMILVKRTDTTSDWNVYHRSLGNTKLVYLNNISSEQTISTTWNNTSPTSSEFTVGTDTDVNANGGTFVAYLFAHDAGGFGESGTDNVISCGSFTTDANGDATVNLGYEPQYILYKRSSYTGSWYIFDNMRGMANQGSTAATPTLYANVSNTETANAAAFFATATGFQMYNQEVSSTLIYMAIRRGPMKTPTLGTSVFSPITSSATVGTQLTTNFPIDSQWINYRTGATENTAFNDRLRGNSSTTTSSGNILISSSPAAEGSITSTRNWDNTGFQIPTYYSGGSTIYWNFRRAPGFFDEVCYTGTGSTPQNVTHNLGVAPELMIVKVRSAVRAWTVYAGNAGQYLTLNATDAVTSNTNVWGSTAPTSSVFRVGNFSSTNPLGEQIVAYLFATLAGVSKVGSYTGTGSTQTINAGLPTGARFVLIKRTDDVGNWWVWDTARGMVAGTDPRLNLNTTDAEINNNWVYTATNGFQIVTSDATVNASGGSYIYLAIA